MCYNVFKMPQKWPQMAPNSPKSPPKCPIVAEIWLKTPQNQLKKTLKNVSYTIKIVIKWQWYDLDSVECGRHAFALKCPQIPLKLHQSPSKSLKNGIKWINIV